MWSFDIFCITYYCIIVFIDWYRSCDVLRDEIPFKSSVNRRPIHLVDSVRHAQLPLDWDSPIPSRGTMLPTANWNSVSDREEKLIMTSATYWNWTYAIYWTSMEAGIMIDHGIRDHAGRITVPTIGSPENEFEWVRIQIEKCSAFTSCLVCPSGRCRPILLCPANHFDTHDWALPFQKDHFCVDEGDLWLCCYGSVHPIQSDHFDCADNWRALDDLIDNTPTKITSKIHLIIWRLAASDVFVPS